jgi:hypothetical protein
MIALGAAVALPASGCGAAPTAADDTHIVAALGVRSQPARRPGTAAVRSPKTLNAAHRPSNIRRGRPRRIGA